MAWRKPQYGGEHERIRRALLAGGQWIGAPCPRCGEKMWPGQPLDLDHRTDENGRRIGGYNGLAHSHCNRSVNAWGHQSRGTVRTPQRRDEITALEKRRERRKIRSEFDAVQEAIERGELLAASHEVR